MKRRRNSGVSDSDGKKRKKETEDIQVLDSGSSISDLPRDILLNILIRLSIKRILVSKYVCKTWYDLVTDPQFAKLHFERGEVYPLIRTSYSRYRAKVVYLMQPNKDDFDNTNVEAEIEAKFEIPARYGLMKSNHKYVIDTCNGLLCLSSPSDEYELGPPIVCNPVTGEYINLPQPEKIGFTEKIDFNGYNTRCGFIYGFGFSPATNQYKVIRVSGRRNNSPLGNKVDVHILGTKTWNHIGFSDHALPMLSPAYLNGFLYWFHASQALRISTFDIEKERFGSVPAPKVNQPFRYYSVGVLGAELCISMVHNSVDIHVWTMKDDGVGKAWSKVFSFDRKGYIPTPYYGSFHPIKYLNDGALLMFYSLDDSLVYMDPKQNRIRHLKVCQLNDASKVKAIAYTPSFVSLKRSLSGHKLKVHNVMSR